VAGISSAAERSFAAVKIALLYVVQLGRFGLLMLRLIARSEGSTSFRER
jgi:hypothetical protein